MVVIDTGAGGGNYASASFVKTVEATTRGRHSTVTSARNSHLRAVNPKASDELPIEIVNSCVLPLVFAPVTRVFRLTHHSMNTTASPLETVGAGNILKL